MIDNVVPHPSSRGGDGPADGGGGMNERLIRLEADTAHLQRDVTELRADMKDVRDKTLAH